MSYYFYGLFLCMVFLWVLVGFFGDPPTHGVFGCFSTFCNQILEHLLLSWLLLLLSAINALKMQFCPEVVQALGAQLREPYNQRITQSWNALGKKGP